MGSLNFAQRDLLILHKKAISFSPFPNINVGMGSRDPISNFSMGSRDPVQKNFMGSRDPFLKKAMGSLGSF